MRKGKVELISSGVHVGKSMSNFEQRCKNEPDKVIKFLLECQSRQAKRIFDYSNKISALESEIEMTHKVVKKVTSQEVFEKFNSQLEKKKSKEIK